MTTAMQIPAYGNIPSASSFQEIPLICISESKTNPRRQFDETSLAELAANIRQHGVLQAVLVRPLPAGEPSAFELVAGARRYRASKLAGRDTIQNARTHERAEIYAAELELRLKEQFAEPRQPEQEFGSQPGPKPRPLP
jgi:ParB family chromosome partitioning protein